MQQLVVAVARWDRVLPRIPRLGRPAGEGRVAPAAVAKGVGADIELAWLVGAPWFAAPRSVKALGVWSGREVEWSGTCRWL